MYLASPAHIAQRTTFAKPVSVPADAPAQVAAYDPEKTVHANGLYKGTYRVKMVLMHMSGTKNSSMGVYPWHRESDRAARFQSCYKQIYNYKGEQIRLALFYDWGNMKELIGCYDLVNGVWSGNLPQANR